MDFNARVLALAEDPAEPLLERAKFLAIFASNLDEFYMVRVAGLKRRREMGLTVNSADGLNPGEQLALISARTQELVERHGRCFTDDDPARPRGCRDPDRALGSGRPATTGSACSSTSWTTSSRCSRRWRWTRPTRSPTSPASASTWRSSSVTRRPGAERFARLKVPNNVDRLVRVRRGEFDYLPLEDLIAAHLGILFPGMQVVEYQVFRVTRNADLEVAEDRDEDLLQALERELARRRFGPPVRLEIADTTSERILDLLINELDVDPADAVEVPGLLDLSCMFQLYGLDRPTLKDPPFVPATNPAFAEGENPKSVFATLRDGDVLLHHPYESFATTVQRFIEQAAADRHVLAIKQTLYRTSGDSPIVQALIEAAAAGKQVVALVEVKARFDEQANISWAKALEKAGVHVVYGLVGLKTHCKTALVVRQEGNVIRRYCHIGTGNYNPKTARIYEDLGLLTADPDIGADLTDLFNVLTGYSRQTEYRNLLVAPQGIRDGIVHRIHREIEHVKAGRSGLVRLKMNSIVDEPVIDALYRASMAGVEVDITVRGICALRAGCPGSEREHGRAFDRRPFPRALPGLPLRQRRRRRVLDRQRGHDAPQPGPPGRGAGADQGRRPRWTGWRSCWRSSADPTPAAGGWVRRAGTARRRTAVATSRRCCCAEAPVPSDPAPDPRGRRPALATPDVRTGRGGPGAPTALQGLVAAQGEGGPRRDARGDRAPGGAGGDRVPDAARTPSDHRPVRGGRRSEAGRVLRGPGGGGRLHPQPRGRQDALAVARRRRADLMTYDFDRAVLDTFERQPVTVNSLVLVRHARAGVRESWDGPDALRPLDAKGRKQAAALRRDLPPFGACAVHSAPVERCRETVAGVAKDLGLTVRLEASLGEDAYRDNPAAARRLLAQLGAAGQPVVVCSQGGVIPGVVKSLAGRADLKIGPTSTPKSAYWVLTFDGTTLVQADPHPAPVVS